MTTTTNYTKKKMMENFENQNYNVHLKVATVAGAVHAALGKLYEILRSRKTRSQTCNVIAYDTNVTKLFYMNDLITL